MDLTTELVVLGAVEGLTIGLLAAGLVLAFRASRVINLAQAQIGAFAAALLAIMVLRWEAPYWSAVIAAVAVGALVGAGIELTVVRRLRDAPSLMTLVATLGAAQILQLLGASIAHDEFRTQLFPHPPGVPSVRLGALTVPPASVALLVLGPLAIAAVAYALRATTFGLALRASSDEPEAARALGIPARRYTTAAWAIAGALSALTAVFLMATSSAPAADALGPSLLLRALAAAVLAGMRSLPVAVGAGIAIGVVDTFVRSRLGDPGAADALLLGLVAVALLLRNPASLRRVDPRVWSAFEPWSRWPRKMARRAAWVTAALGLALAGFVPVVASSGDEVRLAAIACTALVGVSVWLLAGLAGELSLGQFALAGVGAAASAGVGGAMGNTGVGLVAAALAGAGLGALTAALTARAGGIALAVITLAFALAAETWLLPQEWALGDGMAVAPLRLGPIDTSSSAGAYLVCVAALAAAIAWGRGVAHGRFGRRLRAMRDNAAAARAYGVPVQALRVHLLAAAGAVAAVAGTLLAHALTTVTPAAFPVWRSVEAVVITVVGGLAIASAPLLGAGLVAVLPALVDLPAAALAATATGWLALLLYAPGGVAALLRPGHTWLGRRLSHRDPGTERRATVSSEAAADLVVLSAAFLSHGERPAPATSGAVPVLEIEGIYKRFGHVTAVHDAGLHVAGREIVAIVGPNGAGKTTLIDVACGLERPDRGRVLICGEDVSDAPPEARARRGVARSFQDATLFPTLTVEELVLLGAEAAAGRRRERELDERVHEVLELVNLQAHAGTRVRALSTGMRRVAELAAMLAMRARILVLDEPSAGLAEPETEALAGLLQRVRDAAGTAMLIVEHDLRLVAALADRALVMDGGLIVAGGTPGEVLGTEAGDLEPAAHAGGSP